MYVYISRDFVGDIIIHSVSTMLIYFSTLRFPSTPITPPKMIFCTFRIGAANEEICLSRTLPSSTRHLIWQL